MQLAALHQAAASFKRAPRRFVIGLERYSFARIERDWGLDSANCKVTFRCPI